MEESSSEKSPNGIQHNPRKRAQAPGFNAVFQEPVKVAPLTQEAINSPEARILEIRGKRYGPEVIQWGCYAGAAAVMWTYANGFLHLYNKNRQGWANTFRHRIFILSPVMALYACGNGVVPMPFKRHIEQMLGRPALSTMDLMGAKQRLKEQSASPIS